MILTRAHLNRATLARQMLLAREGEVTAAEAVQRLCGMQAQEPKHPFIGLWTRLEAFQREDLHAALHNREVVRGTLMRGTLHLAGPEQYAAMRPALQPVLSKGMRALGDRADGLDLEKALPAARKLLVEYPRTFTELRAALQEQFPKVNERALGFAVRMHLPLLMVPTDSRWAYPQDAHFSLTDEDGRELFDLPGAALPDADVPAPPRFLPEFDSLVLAHKDRSRLLPDEHKGKVVTKNLRVRATFLWEGMVSGTWRIDRRKQVATLEISPFAKLPERARKELAEEGEGLVRFAEEDAESFVVTLSRD